MNFCFHVQPENQRLNFVIYNFRLRLRKFVLADKVFCKHLDLVISQLLDKIFQQFKEQKWCPSLGAPNFRVFLNYSEFGVTKNSDAYGHFDLKKASAQRAVEMSPTNKGKSVGNQTLPSVYWRHACCVQGSQDDTSSGPVHRVLTACGPGDRPSCGWHHWGKGGLAVSWDDWSLFDDTGRFSFLDTP